LGQRSDVRQPGIRDLRAIEIQPVELGQPGNMY
jgi:hypothetical protein